MRQTGLSDRRSQVLADLKLLLPHVGTKHRSKNTAELQAVKSADPPIEDTSWGRVSFLCGTYGRFMWEKLSHAQDRDALWACLLWSVSYEQHFQPRFTSQRIKSLLNVFSTPFSTNQEWVQQAWEDLQQLVQDLQGPALRTLRRLLAEVRTQPPPAELVVAIDERLEEVREEQPGYEDRSPLPAAPEGLDTDDAPVFAALDKTWDFLDKRKEHRNREQVTTAAENPDKVGQLEFLARMVAKNVIWRLTHGTADVSNDQLESAIQLSDFAGRHAKGKALHEARRYQTLLRGVLGMRHHSLDPESFAGEVDSLSEGLPAGKEKLERGTWTDLAALVRFHLDKRRVDFDYPDKVEAEAWIRVFAARPDKIDALAREALVAECEEHGVANTLALEILKQGRISQPGDDPSEATPLAFLAAGAREEFEDNVRNGRSADVRESLRGGREALLSSLSRVLADESYRHMKPPRRAFRPKKGNFRLFEKARTLIGSEQREDRRKALSIFESFEREATHPDYRRLAGEWLLFARARALGPVRVVKQWEDHRKSQPSWEEIWNLAVFYLQTSSPGRALSVLDPGIRSLRAPFSHLRFALYASVQSLDQDSGEAMEAESGPLDFLARYLPLLPLPECYLVWFLIIEDSSAEADVLRQAEMLGIYQDLSDRPVQLLSPEDELELPDIERFRERLQQLNLEKTWRLWVNDFAARRYTYHKPWQWLSEASERAGDLDRAEEALLHIVQAELNKQIGRRRRAMGAKRRRKPGLEAKLTLEELRFVRLGLSNLFQFYRRNAMNDQAESAFRSYYRIVPQLWDARESSNNLLIGLTRTHLNEITSEEGLAPEKLPTGADKGTTAVWTNLYPDLAEVRTASALSTLESRIVAAIESLPTGQKVVRERAEYIRQVCAELGSIEERQWRHDEVLPELESLNRNIRTAAEYVESESTLRPLKALVAALERSFEELAQRLRAVPTPDLSEESTGHGIADDLPETSIVIGIRNPGPGEIQNIRLTCTDTGTVGSRGAGVLAGLSQGAAEVIAVPISVSPPEDRAPVPCRLNAEYDWGIVSSLTHQVPITANWLSFGSFIQGRGVEGYEIPVPYVFDAIDFQRHDPRLFQGRADELQLIRATMLRDQNPGAPIYFHGIRKVGKTSLLRRIALLLQEESLVALVADLVGLDPAAQGLAAVVNSLTEKICAVATREGLELTNEIAPIGTEHPNPVLAFEHFLQNLSLLGGDRPLVLLLDEFHNLANEVTTPILDLFRHFHQKDSIWFVLSGWMRPEPLRASCPQTNLFPLMHRPVDFLSPQEVEQCLVQPVSDYGVEIPKPAAQRAYKETAGNPYHLARIAYLGMELLNREHRTVLASNDVTQMATELARDPANFLSSSFSHMTLSVEERETAIRLAQDLQGPTDVMDVKRALERFSPEIVQSLEEKYILELVSGQGLRIRSPMLARFLRDRLVESKPLPLAPTEDRHRIGIFVDFENVWGGASQGMTVGTLAEALQAYASTLGQVVCRWACAHPANLKDPTGARLELERAGFDVRFPRDEVLRGRAKPNAADFLLLECITDERTHSQPDVYMIVTGDKDYYERTVSLLEKGYAVRVVSSAESTATAYKTLADQRRLETQALGRTESDFHLDDLAVIISGREVRADSPPS